jgi:hypothetical protein
MQKIKQFYACLIEFFHGEECPKHPGHRVHECVYGPCMAEESGCEECLKEEGIFDTTNTGMVADVLRRPDAVRQKGDF